MGRATDDFQKVVDAALTGEDLTPMLVRLQETGQSDWLVAMDQELELRRLRGRVERLGTAVNVMEEGLVAARKHLAWLRAQGAPVSAEVLGKVETCLRCTY